jgi:hypothetical protein
MADQKNALIFRLEKKYAFLDNRVKICFYGGSEKSYFYIGYTYYALMATRETKKQKYDEHFN